MKSKRIDLNSNWVCFPNSRCDNCGSQKFHHIYFFHIKIHPACWAPLISKGTQNNPQRGNSFALLSTILSPSPTWINKYLWLSAKVDSSRTHFQVLGLGLEVSSLWPWPRRLRSSKIALSSARGQHHFLNRWSFVGKRQKPRGKFANTVILFRNLSIGLAKRASPPIEISPMTKMWQKSLLFRQYQFLFNIFCLNR